MSSFTTWLWGTSQLDDAIDKATSELLPAGAEDIALNLEICDQIRSKSVPTKDAMRALKRRLNHKNPNVQLLALGLTDICIKNGGDHFLAEVASREFIDNLVSILKIPTLNTDVKSKMLRLIQNWGVAFEGKPMLSYVGQVYKTLKSEGYKFPPQDLVVANSAMVDTQTAPEWIDSEVCLRCRTPFTFTNRKHHCRNCGQVFDQSCSAKSMPLPHFGISQEVRVCDGCYSKLSKKAEKSHGAENKEHHHTSSQGGSRHRSARELADAELQRAIQLSLQEGDVASGHSRPGYVPFQPPSTTWQSSEPPLVDRNTHPDSKSPPEEDDPDLRAAIEASLREANAPKPSAPVEIETARSDEASSFVYRQQNPQSYPSSIAPKLPNYDLEPLESDVILTFSQTVEQAHAQGGRDMSRYPGVTELYDKANSLRPKLAMNLDDTGRKEQMLSEMHDKLSQAVKLYDQLLTQQISQPRWRSSLPTTAPNVSYQQANPNYAVYNAVNGNNQWTPKTQLATSTESPVFDQIQTQRQSQPSQTFSTRPAQEYQSPTHPPTGLPGQTYSAESFLQQQQQQQRPLLGSPKQNQFPQDPVNISNRPQLGVSSQHPQPSQPSQYPPLVPYTVQTPIPPTLKFNRTAQLMPPQLSGSIYQNPTSVVLPQSPPPQPQQYGPLPQSPVYSKSHPLSMSLSRHNTVTSPPRAANAYLSRHNTVANTQVHLQPQLQSVSAPLPQFPVAPTSAPQAFPLYGPSVPTSTPQPERKEVLLIDL